MSDKSLIGVEDDKENADGEMSKQREVGLSEDMAAREGGDAETKEKKAG